MVGIGYIAREYSMDKKNRSLSLSLAPSWSVLILPDLFAAVSSFQLQVNPSYILNNRLSPPLVFPSWGLDPSTFKCSHVAFIIKLCLNPTLQRYPLTPLLNQISPKSRLNSFFYSHRFVFTASTKHQSHLLIKATFPKTEDDGQLKGHLWSPSYFLLFRAQWWWPLSLSPPFDIYRNKLFLLIS